MHKRSLSALFLMATVLLSSCATDNGPDGFSGGFSASPVGEDGFYVGFRGNGFTTPQTIQDYFLYNCAVLVLGRGYEGFEIASSSLNVTSAEADSQPIPMAGVIPYLANGLAFNIVSGSALQDNIRMLRKPFAHNPPKVFDASLVKAALEPYVTGKKCDRGNICPHPDDYLRAK